MTRKLILLFIVATLFVAASQSQEKPRVPRTILAIGAHAGDMELTCGALLVKQRQLGDRVVILHLTLGEGGNPRLSPREYGEQKRREATAAAAALGAEVIFGPFRDGELPDTDETKKYVAGVIRQVKPSLVLTHWQNSMHKDHATASAITRDAILLAALPAVELEHPAWRGVGSLWYAENWEDTEGFSPYIYVNVTGSLAKWREAVTRYEFVRGGISSFSYLSYYAALASVRGAEARKEHAIAFDIEPYGKRRILEDLP